jgi:hypothetical protein
MLQYANDFKDVTAFPDTQKDVTCSPFVSNDLARKSGYENSPPKDPCGGVPTLE